MKRKRAVRNFIAVAILTVLSVLAAVMSFDIPYSYNTYNGFISGINTGYDFGKGITGYYSATPTVEDDNDFEKNLKKLESEFDKFFSEVATQYTLNRTSEGIKVKTPNINNLASALRTIESKGEIAFKSEESTTAKAAVGAEHIDSISYLNNGGSHGVLIVFTQEGAKEFESLTTAQIGGNIYLYVGETLFSQNSVSEALTGGVVFLGTSSNVKADAYASAIKLNASLKGIDISAEQILITSPVFNNIQSIAIIVVLVLLLLKVLVSLILNYRHLGWILGMMILLQLSVMLFVYALIPNAIITLTSVLGFVFAFVLIVSNTYTLINSLKTEFKTGKKFSVSVRFAFKNILGQIATVNGLLFLSGILMLTFAAGIVTTFIIPLIIASAVSTLFVLVINKLMIKNYLSINSTEHKKLGFEKVEVLGENE